MNIYDDLVRVGHIKTKQDAIAKKINDQRAASPAKSSRPSTPVPARSITAEEVAAMIVHPMSPVKNNSSLICDNITIAAVCDSAHIHKYLVKDILSTGILSRCKTCNYSGTFPNAARLVAESLLGKPFALIDTGSDDRKFTKYFNPAIGITITCARGQGTDTSALSYPAPNSPKLEITIFHTSNNKKLKDSLHCILSKHAPALGIKSLPPLNIHFTRDPVPAISPEIFDDINENLYKLAPST